MMVRMRGIIYHPAMMVPYLASIGWIGRWPKREERGGGRVGVGKHE